MGLEGAIAKVDRADSHLRNLRDAKPASVSFIHHESRSELAMYASLPPDRFLEYSITVGEIVHHLRSALEHSVWDLAEPLKRGRNTTFPILLTSAEFSSKGVKTLDGIEPKAISIIEAAQPYHGDVGLGDLHTLWNIDKHRTLATCITHIQAVSLIFRHPDGRSEEMFITPPKILAHGQEIFRLPFDGNAEPMAEVAFSDVVFDFEPFRKMFVVQKLNALTRTVRDVVTRLAAV